MARFSVSKNNKGSLYTGVYKIPNGWMALCIINGERKKYGPFVSEKDAAVKYDEIILKYNQKRRLNFPTKAPVIEKNNYDNRYDTKNRNEYKNEYRINNFDIKIKRKIRPSHIRNKIACNQDWKCNMCSSKIPPNFEIDHIVPLFLDGPDENHNCQALCNDCHVYKSSILDQKIKKLKMVKNISKEDVFKLQKDNLHEVKCIPRQNNFDTYENENDNEEGDNLDENNNDGDRDWDGEMTDILPIENNNISKKICFNVDGLEITVFGKNN